MTTRIPTLTVSHLWRQWGEPHRKRDCTVPSIRLSGKWMSQLGIASGQKICVTTNGATITLSPISFDATGMNSKCVVGVPAAVQLESLRTGSRTTRKCDLLYS